VLYRPDWHEPLTDRAWDEAWVRDAAAALTHDAVQAWDPDAFWPAHEWDAFGTELPLKDLFTGAAGVVWALARLDADFDGAAAAIRVHERFRAEPTLFGGAEPPAQARSSLFNGETGIALVRYLLTPSDDLRAILEELIRANLANDVNELMWGVPGTLLAARAIGADELARESEAALRAARDEDGWWTQHLYGHVERVLGPIHGLLGNAFALGELESTVPMLRGLAVRDGAHVNWPPGPTDHKFRLQWCHGAPGVLTTATAQLDEDLLLGGAQLIWDAGPLDRVEKNAGLCHGTAGNGYALLKAFERTQDELWLGRARAFAVHALEQALALPPRYSLFTGGIGAVLYARDVLATRAAFPVLDWLQSDCGPAAI
jgi:hypothetical protein